MKSGFNHGMAMVILYVLVASTAGCSAMDTKGATQSVGEQRKAQEAQIPLCTHKLGSVAVNEPEAATNWWTGQQLPAPSKLIKVFVSKSGCFTLVDRGAGMDAAVRERALASGGDLRAQSNLGKGQIKAADYVLVPDLVSNNSNAGGSAIGGIIGGLIGGTAGAIASNVNFSTKTADVVLTLTDVRSSEQVAMTEGNAKKTDMGFGAGSTLFGGSGLGAAGIGGYTNTTAGQVITMAYLHAYTQMVTQLGGLSGDAAQSNVKQSVTVATGARMLSSASGGKAVRDVAPGMMLYPTGSKQGSMWEVEDEMGNRGWINSTQLQLSR
jgi:curli biogenesis system outer membrane secretion channel CsgG